MHEFWRTADRQDEPRLLPVEEVVVRLDILGQIPQVKHLARAKAKDVHLVQLDRRAVGTARRLMEDHRGVVVVGVDAPDVKRPFARGELEVLISAAAMASRPLWSPLLGPSPPKWNTQSSSRSVNAPSRSPLANDS